MDPNSKNFYEDITKYAEANLSQNDNEAIQCSITLTKKYGRLRLSNILLDDNSEINEYNKYNDVIKSAIKNTLVKFLLESGLCDPSINKNYAIRTASQNGYIGMVKLSLMFDGCRPHENNNEAIRDAIKNGYLEVVELLWKIDKCKSVTDNKEAIVKAVENGHLEVVKFLTKIGKCKIFDSLDPNILSTVCENGHLKMAMFLVNNMDKFIYDIGIDDAFNRAIENGRIEIVKYLFNTGLCDLKRDRNRAVDFAVMCGYIEVITFLFNTGIYHPLTNDKKVALAVSNNRFEVVKYLVEICKSDPSVNNNEAIREAIKKGHLEVVKFLVESGLCRINLPQAIINAKENIYCYDCNYDKPINYNRKDDEYRNDCLKTVAYLREEKRRNSLWFKLNNCYRDKRVNK